MMGFMFILAFITIGFSLIFLEFSKLTSTTSDDQSYGDKLYSTYQVMYGNTEDASDPSQRILLALILFVFNVLLLNLLISIMGNTYDTVQENRVVTDALTRLDLILESMAIMRFLGRRKTAAKENRGYLIYCGAELVEREIHEKPKGEDEDIIFKNRGGNSKSKQEDEKRWRKDIENKILTIQKNVDMNCSELRKEFETTKTELKEQMESNNNELKELLKGITEKLKHKK